jgi:hypothetical protein
VPDVSVGWRKNLGIRSAFAVAAIGAVLVLSVAGCGGGSSSPAASSSTGNTTSRTAPTTTAGKTTAAPGDEQPKARVIAQADGICKRLNVELEASFPKRQSRTEVLRVVPRNVISEQKALSELNKLAPPASFAAEWRRMLGYRQALATELAKFLQSERSNDQVAVKALNSAKRRAHAALQATAKSGFEDCAKLG